MSTSKVLLGIIAGLAAGAMVGLLLAPDSGSNTRKKISSKGQGLVDDMKTKFSDFMDGVMHQVETVKEDANDIADKAKTKIGDTMKKVSHYNT